MTLKHRSKRKFKHPLDTVLYDLEYKLNVQKNQIKKTKSEIKQVKQRIKEELGDDWLE